MMKRARKKHLSNIFLSVLILVVYEQGFYGQGKSGNFEWVRESQGKQRGSGKSKENTTH